jgi:hypothetical protein
MKNTILILFLLFGANNLLPILSVDIYAMSLDDEEDKEDVQDLLDEAKKASKNESLNKANELLKKAKQYSTDLVDVKNTQSLVDTKKQRRYNNSPNNYGLSKDKCYRTNNNFALHKYCSTGSCEGFVSNYALYKLCKNDDASGFYGSKKNLSIAIYLEGGGYLDYDYFSNQATHQSGKHNESFRTRKNFILYLMSGMVLVKY